ncbi:hypothetical protein [Rhodalgimonas zhirmunskyi]|uniref:Uncharacterized protein n=1 Tax=Rhodalgimonas zhirmunskyi TaxID=2964767 RepID=A0AAJ1U5R6_9RHOB|nr:hypothetical protein [Rhodoalgimonas zhirmunskyi]MDQ2093635.1 hypothetical protein [Rhodoalgimonas zhirmunskyi]
MGALTDVKSTGRTITTAQLQGHWRRVWIKAPGFEDARTRVHWMQCGAAYADLRIPADRPQIRGAHALEDLPDKTIARLMQAEGFAGSITVKDSICTWTRAINWHGPTADVDAGLMSFGPAGDLIEEGVHGVYTELWQRETDAPFEALRVRHGALEGWLLVTENRFLLAIDRLDAPTQAEVEQMLGNGARHEALEARFTGAYVLGHWAGGKGIAQVATNPFLENRPLLERRPNGALYWTTMRPDGHWITAPLEAETIARST